MSNKTAAKSELLGRLHAKMAEIMLNTLMAYDEKQAAVAELCTKAKDLGEPDLVAGVFIQEPSPALLGAITKFLKDNEITCNTEDSAEMSELGKRLEAKTEARKLRLADLPIQEGAPN